MAAVVASPHTGFWQRRTDPSYHMSDLTFTSIMSPYNNQRSMPAAPSPRSFQPTTQHMDASLPLFPGNVLATSLPYQSGTFAFDHVSVNPYNMSPNFPVSYSSSIPSAISYAESTVQQTLPTAREAHNVFIGDRNALVKSES